MSTIRKALNAIKHADRLSAGQVKVIDLVDGAIAVGPRGQYVQESRDLGLIINGTVAAGPDDDPTDADLRAAVAAILGYDPETTN
jgi:hypothetical protein